STLSLEPPALPLPHGSTVRFPRAASAVNGPGRDRTCDLGIKSPLLYQLSYRPARRRVTGRHRYSWLAGPPSTSGPGHSPFKAVARVRIPLGAPGRLAQLGERLPYKQEVGGSIPSPPIEGSSRRYNASRAGA